MALHVRRAALQLRLHLLSDAFLHIRSAVPGLGAAESVCVGARPHARAMHGRPLQPDNLTRHSRAPIRIVGERTKPRTHTHTQDGAETVVPLAESVRAREALRGRIPGPLLDAHAQRLGVIHPMPEAGPAGARVGVSVGEADAAAASDAEGLRLAPRQVDRDAMERDPNAFTHARAAYRRALSRIRSAYASEISASAHTLQADVDAAARAVEARKARAAAARRERKEARAKEHEKNVVTGAEATRARKAARRETALERERRTAERRAAWLDALERDASTWIHEDRIDTAITPETFSLKYAWMYTRWFARRDELSRRNALARRAHAAAAANARSAAAAAARGGGSQPAAVAVPFSEVVLTDDEFETDWESDGEGSTEFLAKELQKVPASDAGPAPGSAPVDVTVSEAAARLAFARNNPGSPFPERHYDTATHTHSDPAAAALSSAGMQLEELAAGKPASEIAREYEAWMQEYAELRLRNMKLSEEDASALPRDPHGRLILDDGERDKENAYIDMCVRTRAIEPLYAALAHKRARLARDHPHALSAFNESWGSWLATIEGTTPSEIAVAEDEERGATKNVAVLETDAGAADGVNDSELVASGATAALSEAPSDGTSARTDVDTQLNELFAAIGPAARRTPSPATSRTPAAPRSSDAQEDLSAVDGSAAAGFALDQRNVDAATRVAAVAREDSSAAANAAAKAHQADRRAKDAASTKKGNDAE